MARSYENFDRPYRRGLVLGLSLAELFLILIFLLLLIGFGLNQVKEKENKELTKENQALTEKLNELTDQLDAIYETVGSKISLEDFTTLVKSAGERQRLINENNELRDNLADAQKKLDEIKELTKILEENNVTPEQLGDLIEAEEGLVEALADIKQLQTQINQQNDKINELEIEVATKDAENEILDAQVAKLEKGLADSNEQVQILAEAKGIDPPCWFRQRPGSTETKKLRPIPVKLFDIQIRDNGLIVRPKDNSAYANIAVDYGNTEALTNLTSMPYGTLLSKRQFLSEFGWIRVAGKQGEVQSYPCMFMVDLFDGTSAGNKSGYKRLKEGTVEALFNTFLPKDPW